MTVKGAKSRKNSLVNRIISLRKPTALDKIIEKIPKPRGAVPNFGLPKWKHIPLESKIPMIAGPKDAYNFTRKKLGKKLWLQTKNAKFNLSDPCNYEMEFSYDSLHDEHLARYFSQERNTRRLLKLGFISKNMDAKCTLRDYNMYRKFLKKLHDNMINEELKRRASLIDERRVLEFADSAAKREIERLKKEERKVLARDKAREEERLEEEKKRQKYRDAAEKLRKRLELIELAKKEQERERIAKLRAKMERARRKRAEVLESEKAQVIENLVAWAAKESNRKKARKERLAREAEDKRKAIQEQWDRRKAYEEFEIARNQSILRYAEEERERSIQNYTNKIERERAMMQTRFKKIRRFLGCYMVRNAAGRKKGTCCGKSMRRRKRKSEDDGEKSNNAKSNSTPKMQKMSNGPILSKL